jgi:hypothetical protein
MFTTILPTLVAAASLSTQTVNPSTAATTVAAAPAAKTTAVAVPAPQPKRSAARIPGTFAVVADGDALEGLHALYVVRTGDGA